MLSIRFLTTFTLLVAATIGAQAGTLEEQLKNADPKLVADEARRRGDPNRGAMLYFKSSAGCVQCHQRTDS